MPLPPARAPQIPQRRAIAAERSGDGGDLAHLLTTTAIAIGKLDERLRAAGEPIRTGWLARSTLAEVAASSTLERYSIDATPLALFELGALPIAPEFSASRALQHLRLLRRLLARGPRPVFTPNKLLANVGRTTRDAALTAADPRLEPMGISPEDTLAANIDAIDAIFSPAGVAELTQTAPLRAAANILAAWNADRLLAGDIGRALAMLWLRHTRVTTLAPLFPAIGFVGEAASYRPWAVNWPRLYLAAVGRASESGLQLAARLTRSADALDTLGGAQRSTSAFPRFTAYAIEVPLITAPLAAQHLGITVQAALRHIDRLLEAKAITEITKRKSFRVFELAQF